MKKPIRKTAVLFASGSLMVLAMLGLLSSLAIGLFWSWGISWRVAVVSLAIAAFSILLFFLLSFMVKSTRKINEQPQHLDYLSQMRRKL